MDQTYSNIHIVTVDGEATILVPESSTRDNNGQHVLSIMVKNYEGHYVTELRIVCDDFEIVKV